MTMANITVTYDDDRAFFKRLFRLNAAGSPDDYSREQLAEMLSAFDEGDPEMITRPGVPFSLPEIQRAILRAERLEDGSF